MLLSRTKAALGLTLAGSPDAKVREALANGGATRTLAAILELEFGEVAIGSSLPARGATGNWRRDALSYLLRYAYDGEVRSLELANAVLPTDDLGSEVDRQFCTAVRVHVASETGNLRSSKDLLDSGRLDTDLRNRLLGVSAPLAVVEAALGGASGSSPKEAVAIAFRLGLPPSVIDRLLTEQESHDRAALDSDVELLQLVAEGAGEEVMSRLLADRAVMVQDLADGAAVLGYRWTRHGRAIWAFRVGTAPVSVGVFAQTAARTALQQATPFIPTARPLPLSWARAAFWRWDRRRDQGFASLGRLSDLMVPDELAGHLQRGEIENLVVELPSVFERVPFEALPLPDGSSMSESAILWRLPPVFTASPSDLAPRPPTLLIEGPGIVEPLGLDLPRRRLGTEPASLTAKAGDQSARAEQPGHEVVVFHGHAAAGADVGPPAEGHHDGDGVVEPGNKLAVLSTFLPPKCRGLVAVCCEGGGQQSRATAERWGVAGDAFAHGVDWVISSTWPVPDDGTTTRFVGRLADRLAVESPGRALAQVQSEAFDAGLNPLYWASWACFGLPGGAET